MQRLRLAPVGACGRHFIGGKRVLHSQQSMLLLGRGRNFSSPPTATPEVPSQDNKTKTTETSTSTSTEEKLVYAGPLGKKLQRIRRISISSSFFTIFGLPVALRLAETGASVMSQYALSGTLMFATVSSTIFLQLITNPYITDIHKISSSNSINSNSDSNSNSSNSINSNGDNNSSIRYRATKLNLFGTKVVSEFKLSDIVKSPSMSVAFTNFSANKEREVVEKEMVDPDLAMALTRLLGKYKSKEELEKEEAENEEDDDNDDGDKEKKTKTKSK